MTIDIDELREAVQTFGSQAINEDDLNELLSRLEAAESDAIHQKALADSALRVAEGWERTCCTLRAKVEQMEKQEPVAEWLPLDSGEDTRRD